MSTPHTPGASSSSTVHSIPKAKLTAISRFKQAAGDYLGIKNEPEIVFPPPSWFNDDSNPYNHIGSSTSSADSSPEVLDPPEPTTFALKIRQMIESLPLPASVTSAIGIGHAEQGTGAHKYAAPTEERQLPPIPDAMDARTMRLLSSENVMNGDEAHADAGSSHGPHRKSVWSILESMKPGHIKTDSTEHVAGPVPHMDTESTSSTEHSEKGLMMYSPLEPTEDSEVEIAELKECYADESASGVDQGKGKGKVSDPSPLPPTKTETQWVPSTTKISVLTTWWGYRLYLPPPVMETLDSNQIVATQRAAMITTALTWFLRKVPTMIVPAPMVPTVKVLRRLAPLLSYIGVFIAWSWTRISACDQGNGVVLTATWLLPVALIPMAWDAGDIQGPRKRPPTPPEPPQPETDTKASSSAQQKEKKSKR